MEAKRHPVNRAVSLAALLLVVACSPKEEVKPDPAPAVGGSGGDTSEAGATGWTCQEGLPGPKLVLIPTPDGEAYCIDQRETVYAEYKKFLDAQGTDTGGQPPECSWNDRFTPIINDPDSEPTGCEQEQWLIDSRPDLAVNCVDICDAWAYCAWAGKRLCGVRGAATDKLSHLGDSEVDEVAVSAESEWFNVCSQGNTTSYPYGDSYEPGVCVDGAKTQSGGVDARSVQDTTRSVCHGSTAPYDQVYNMSGDVWQWQNICRTSGCVMQGGPWYETDQKRLSCDGSLGVVARRETNFALGIRCCADALPATP